MSLNSVPSLNTLSPCVNYSIFLRLQFAQYFPQRLQKMKWSNLSKASFAFSRNSSGIHGIPRLILPRRLNPHHCFWTWELYLCSEIHQEVVLDLRHNTSSHFLMLCLLSWVYNKTEEWPIWQNEESFYSVWAQVSISLQGIGSSAYYPLCFGCMLMYCAYSKETVWEIFNHRHGRTGRIQIMEILTIFLISSFIRTFNQVFF